MDRFQKFLKFLRSEVPMKRKVVVRRIPMRNDGSTGYSDRGVITVSINSELPLHHQLDTLVHEWGHVYDFDRNGVHGKTWAIGHAESYQAWENFLGEESKL